MTDTNPNFEAVLAELQHIDAGSRARHATCLKRFGEAEEFAFQLLDVIGDLMDLLYTDAAAYDRRLVDLEPTLARLNEALETRLQTERLH